jgi:excisionase family DNA binding protein
MAEADEYLTVQEAATRKAVTVNAIYNAIRDGRLPSRRVLGRIALLPSDVDAFTSSGHGGVRPGGGRPPKKKTDA